MTALPKPFVTPEQYLEQERRALEKSEYYFGEIFAVAGATRAHNRISANVVTAFSNQLRGKPCEVYPPDMRVQTSRQGMYSYPDTTVVCGPPQFVTSTRTHCSTQR